jgi:hypothetical protein
MYKYFLAITLIATITSCDSSKNANNNKKETVAVANTLTEAEQKEGWQLLFDGSSFKGWHKYGGSPVGSAWKIADGCMYLDTTVKENWQIKNGGDVVSDGSYKDFHLQLEWKIAKDGNSGIIFYVNEDTTKYKYGWMTGPEMQVLDNNGHPDSKIIKHRAGDLYDLITVSKETVKPAGEWNKAEIKSEKNNLTFYLNGEAVVNTTLWDDAWKKMIAASKFKEFPGFGTYNEGKIMLQDHGNTVWYRNIKIKKL